MLKKRCRKALRLCRFIIRYAILDHYVILQIYIILIAFICTSRVSRKYFRETFHARLKINFPMVSVNLISCIYSTTYRLSGYAKANSHGTCWFNYGSVHIPSAPILPLCAYDEEHPPYAYIGRQSTLTRSYKRGIGDYYMLSSMS